MPEPTDQLNNGGSLMDPPAGDPPAGYPPAGDPSAGDPPKAAEGAPETYEFKPAEGQEFDPEFIKVYSEVAKGLDLTQDKAQTLLDKLSPVIQERQVARLTAIRKEWTEASTIDSEFGGEKLNENLGIAKQALDKFGTPKLKELLNTSGIGDHPEVIRFFFRAGTALSSDKFVGGTLEGKGAPKTFNDLAAVLYG